MSDAPTIHASAEVSPKATIGARTRVWHQVQIREGARIGAECIFGKGSYVDNDVVVGDRCKVQNGAMLYHGLTLGNGVFVGPGAIFTNDRQPRAITPEGGLKGADDWQVSPIVVDDGASIGAGAIIVAGVRIGKFALIAAGAVVSRDVPDYTLAVGVPARAAGLVCACGATMAKAPLQDGGPSCAACARRYVVEGGRCRPA